MAKDIYDKLKIVPELFKTYWAIIVMCGGLSAGGWQWWDKTDVIQNAESEKNQAVHEVTIGFQKAMVEIKPKKAQSNCNRCIKLINELKEFHP